MFETHINNIVKQIATGGGEKKHMTVALNSRITKLREMNDDVKKHISSYTQKVKRLLECKRMRKEARGLSTLIVEILKLYTNLIAEYKKDNMAIYKGYVHMVGDYEEYIDYLEETSDIVLDLLVCREFVLQQVLCYEGEIDGDVDIMRVLRDMERELRAMKKP